MTDRDLAWQDEILQVMFWMRGEKLGDDISPQDLARFLQVDELEIHLARLAALGLVRSDDAGRFRLTDRGIEEGKRRFADEFSPYLGKESHLECSDPDCDCHSPEFTGVCRKSGTVHSNPGI